jgi:hypothetical protein
LAPAVLLTGLGSTFEAGRFLPGSMPTAIVAVSLAVALVVIPAAFRQMVHVSSTEFSCVYALFGISLARRRLPLAEVTRVWCTDGPRSQGVSVETARRIGSFALPREERRDPSGVGDPRRHRDPFGRSSAERVRKPGANDARARK